MSFCSMMRIGLPVVVFFAGVVCGQEIKVTLLGTGCPTPVIERFGPSILVEAAGQTLLFFRHESALSIGLCQHPVDRHVPTRYDAFWQSNYCSAAERLVETGSSRGRSCGEALPGHWSR